METYLYATFCEHETCDCHGRDGKPKKSYPTEEAALQTAQYIQSRGGPYLRAYQCPWGTGWHLTKA